jgi:hypothetical protein
MSIDTYAKGVSITDNSTESFLNALDAIKKPITVVFYGDHLPGIYTTAGSDSNNSLALHETDYFIWSNDPLRPRAGYEAAGEQLQLRRTSLWLKPPSI